MNLPPATGLRSMMTRRNATRLIAAGMLGSFVDAFFIEPGHLSITRRDIPCARLPHGLGGLRIALMADFHFRPGTDDALLEKVITAVDREKPDLIVLPGDFITSDPAILPDLLGYLRQLRPRHGIFATMGNHDGWNSTSTTFKRHFEQAGIRFLVNEHSVLTINGERLAIAGTDHVWLGNPDPAATLAGLAAEIPVLALVHEPDYFDTMTDQRPILLQVSGHTHGGQCRVPLVGYAPVVPKFGTKYVYGNYARSESQLFVTRGVGTINPRARFACPPELAILTLRPATGLT